MLSQFDRNFFKKYVPEWQEIQGVIHGHVIIIFDKILINLILLAGIPTFLYLKSGFLQAHLDFLYFEIWIFLTFIKMIYDIFDWYNDVRIITDSGVIDLDWTLWSSNNVSLKFDSIEGIEVDQENFLQTMLGTGTLVVHKVGSESFRLKFASKPYDAVNDIEAAQNHIDMDFSEMEDEGPSDERFDRMMEVLGDIVDDHMHKKNGLSRQELEEIEAEREAYRHKKGTIDLS